MNTLGSRLRKARERKRYSQVAVAKHTGINNKSLSRYEADGTEPDADTLKKLAELYEVSVDSLLGREIKGDNMGIVLSKEDKELLEKFNSLNEEDQQYILGLMRRIAKE
jgi:transcriptional regulator with XRE-family HTH domain